jgi:hypothetical protein
VLHWNYLPEKLNDLLYYQKHNASAVQRKFERKISTSLDFVKARANVKGWPLAKGARPEE